jgi:Raf kinase inhibitor-like YbhB/YbcL family protein
MVWIDGEPVLGLPSNAGGRGRERGHAVAVVAVLAGFLLAACGGTASSPGGGTVSSPGGTARSTAATPAASPTGSTAAPAPAAIEVRSAAFAAGAAIPVRFTCKGSNVPPPLSWSGLPAGTASVALVMDDPDAVGGTFTHWVVFNLPPTTAGIEGGSLPPGATQAANSGGQAGYIGPCPPSGTHHYRFTVYAEQRRLELQEGAALPQALRTIKANAVASGLLSGLFSA